MLPSVVHYRDVLVLLERISEKGLLRRIVQGHDERVRGKWRSELGDHSVQHWFEIPEVERRWNRMITGDADIRPTEWIAGTFLDNRRNLKALSPGCGMGGRELQWLETGRFEFIDGIDLSEERIAIARQRAVERGREKGLRLHVGDMRQLDYPEGSYDVILAEQALHHVAPQELMIRRMSEWLCDDGVLIINEYVGPSRFQWTDRQLEAINGLLAALPERLRVKRNGRVKRSVWRPGRLTMYLYDPSEAAESSKTLRLLDEHFEPLAVRGYGGTVLHLLLKDIAHHFTDGSDIEAQQVLQFCFEAEDQLLRGGDLEHDFIVGVYRPRKQLRRV